MLTHPFSNQSEETDASRIIQNSKRRPTLANQSQRANYKGQYKQWFRASLSNTVVLPDIYFHWPLEVLASFVLRVRVIVCVVSSIVLFCNHRTCLKSY